MSDATAPAAPLSAPTPNVPTPAPDEDGLGEAFVNLPPDGLTMDGDRFKVLVNDEEQYSLWPADLPVPAGWRVTGPQGDKATCLAYVEEVWTDMRPASLRRAMAEDEATD